MIPAKLYFRIPIDASSSPLGLALSDLPTVDMGPYCLPSLRLAVRYFFFTEPLQLLLSSTFRSLSGSGRISRRNRLKRIEFSSSPRLSRLPQIQYRGRYLIFGLRHRLSWFRTSIHCLNELIGCSGLKGTAMSLTPPFFVPTSGSPTV